MTTATLIYDGDCGFCTRSAEFARRILPPECAVTAWQQADLGRLRVPPERAQREVVWVSRAEWCPAEPTPSAAP
jgi:hypothetical protein